MNLEFSKICFQGFSAWAWAFKISYIHATKSCGLVHQLVEYHWRVESGYALQIQIVVLHHLSSINPLYINYTPFSDLLYFLFPKLWYIYFPVQKAFQLGWWKYNISCIVTDCKFCSLLEDINCYDITETVC